MAASKLTKNQRRREKNKAKKQENGAPEVSDKKDTANVVDTPPTPVGQPVAEEDEVEIEAMPLPMDINEDDPLFQQFRNVLDRFTRSTEEEYQERERAKGEVMGDDDDQIPDDDGDDEEGQEKPKKSRKQLKNENKLSIAELKAMVKKPELVEWTDTSSQDPRLLLAIKGSRNVIPVPPHWALKREYLSSKRGIEKAAFALPKFIQETGIAEMRDAVLEKQAEASLKQRQRERVQPKMGKLDIDYQKLYEAFFRFQTKPPLTRYGEVYYEGKEFETNMKHLRPGELSDELKEALQIPPGAPPPWLLNQQRHGPPPSYPALKIPGLNAPLPPGASWGFHPGGYGKVPVDKDNRPVWGGDIYGVVQPQLDQPAVEPIDKSLWGELEEQEEAEEEEEEEDDEGEDEEMDEDEMAAGLQTQRTQASGVASVQPSEIGGTGEDFTLRKQRQGTDTEDSPYPRTAGQVIPEQQRQTTGFFGSDRGYDLRGAQGTAPMLGQGERGKKRKAGDVDVSVDVDTLVRDGKLNKDGMQSAYDEQRKAQANPWSSIDQEDLSQMIAEESSKRLKKEGERHRDKR